MDLIDYIAEQQPDKWYYVQREKEGRELAGYTCLSK